MCDGAIQAPTRRGLASPAAAAAAAAKLAPAPTSANELYTQLARLDAAEYQTWLLRTSRGQARFFQSGRLEAVTKVKW